MEFKYGYDSFSFDMFNNQKVSCEQGIFTLLPKGVKYPNSFLQSVPIVFCWNVPEDHPVLRSIATKVQEWLPRKGDILDVDGLPFFKCFFHLTVIPGPPLFSLTVQLLDPFPCRVEFIKDVQ